MPKMTGAERRAACEQAVIDAAYAYAMATLGLELRECGGLIFTCGNTEARAKTALSTLANRAGELVHGSLAATVLDRAPEEAKR